MQKLLIALASLFLIGCAPLQATASDGTIVTPVEDIAAEFRKLRAVQGHFEGGDWDADVDEWMGLKHQLMIELGIYLGGGGHLGGGGYSESEVIRLLDPPDVIAREGDELFKQVSQQAGFQKPPAGLYTLLIYHWRGTHDFVYFVSQDGTVVNSGWWYAGE